MAKRKQIPWMPDWVACTAVWVSLSLTLGLTLGLLGCRPDRAESTSSDARTAQGSGRVDGAGLPSADDFADSSLGPQELARFHVVLETSIDGQSQAPMILRLWPEVAPQTVRNFLRLCRSGFYDGLSFHRILSHFMVQGGCRRGDGTGSSPFGSVPGEFQQDPEYRHRYGVLSMARGNHRDSAGSQFFLICRDGPSAWSLDGEYTSFGELVAGQETLENLAQVEVGMGANGERSRPLVPVRIDRARVVAGPAPEGRVTAEPEGPGEGWGFPNTVTVQSLLLECGDGESASRTWSGARELALELQERLREGADFLELAQRYSEDPVQMSQGFDVGFTFANHGKQPLRGMREVFLAQQTARQKLADVQRRKQAGELDPASAIAARDAVQWELMGVVRSKQAIPRDQISELADAAFELEPGASAIVRVERGAPFEGIFLIRRPPPDSPTQSDSK